MPSVPVTARLEGTGAPSAGNSSNSSSSINALSCGFEDEEGPPAAWSVVGWSLAVSGAGTVELPLDAMSPTLVGTALMVRRRTERMEGARGGGRPRKLAQSLCKRTDWHVHAMSMTASNSRVELE